MGTIQQLLMRKRHEGLVDGFVTMIVFCPYHAHTICFMSNRISSCARSPVSPLNVALALFTISRGLDYSLPPPAQNDCDDGFEGAAIMISTMVVLSLALACCCVYYYRRRCQRKAFTKRHLKQRILRIQRTSQTNKTMAKNNDNMSTNIFCLATLNLSSTNILLC